MKQQPQSIECAGSLTPELEGALRSASHTMRIRPAKDISKTEKEGKKNE